MARSATAGGAFLLFFLTIIKPGGCRDENEYRSTSSRND